MRLIVVVNGILLLLHLCRSRRSLTTNDIDRHFRTNSNLFFLFGIEIHRPFLDENNQTYADASLFIIVICRENSSDCFPRRGSLPSDYELKFSVGNQFYTNAFSEIDGKWHRTKRVNDDFLYQPMNAHGWYDDRDDESGSIWKTWVMTDGENENLYSKWVEFEIHLEDAGIHIIEGEQLYQGEIVQEFEYQFYVPTFRCLRAPSIYFDDFLSTQLYLSAFHFRFDSDQCYIEQYSCQLKRTKLQWINTTYHTVIDVQRDLVNITVDYPSEMIEPLTKDHLKKGTTLNDHISEKMIVGGNFLRADTEISLQAICTSINPLTKRKFVLQAEATKKNDSLNSTDRIDIVVCQYRPSIDPDQCFYSLYDHQSIDRSLLLLPVTYRNITFVGFLRLPQQSPINEWTFLVDETFPKLSSRQLEKSRHLTLSIPSVVDRSSKTFIYSYRIVTDTNRICSFVCENDCVQEELDDDEFFFSKITAELIFFCPNCQWILMTQLRNHLLVLTFDRLTSDLSKFRLMSLNNFHNFTFSCVQPGKTIQRTIRLFRSTTFDTSMCSIKSNSIQPYHDELLLECDLFFIRSEVLLWAVTRLSLDDHDEEVKIWLNPIPLSSEKFDSKRRVKINGIPHGKSVQIEIRSPMFSRRERHVIETNDFTEKSIAAIRIGPDGNFFASAFRLIDDFYSILQNDPIEFEKSRLKSVGFTRTNVLIDLVDYYRLIWNYTDQESLSLKSKDFVEQISSTISRQILQNDLFYLESNSIYRERFLLLLIEFSSEPTLITADMFHLLRHVVKLISTFLPDFSVDLLRKLFELCVQLRRFILHPTSMPISSMTNSRNFVEFNRILSRILVSMHRQIKSKGLTNSAIRYVDDGPMDFFVVEQIDSLTTTRWTLEFDENPISTNVFGLIYFPQEFVPLEIEIDATTYVDYQIVQLLSIEGAETTNFSSSSISFSLRQTFLNVSQLSSKYFYKIVLNRISTKFYSHSFTFELKSSSRVRNLSLLFLDLPHSERFRFTTQLFYNETCRRSTFNEEKTFEFMIEADLWTNDDFVYSIPIESNSFVCLRIEIVSKNVEIRQSQRTAHFLVLETGCYSFSTTIDEHFPFETDRCQLINENSSSFPSPHLTCVCQSMTTKYLLLCQPKSIDVQFEVKTPTWIYFYIYLVVLLFLLLVCGFYALYNDTIEIYKPKIHFVRDNQSPSATIFSYQLTMFTGLQQRSSKNFKINVRLIGANGHDVVHCLTSSNFDGFQPGGVDRFFLTTFVDLGPIIALNVWLDDFESKADFYLRHCILNDLTRHRTFYFCCYSWLSTRKRIKTINELFYVAQQVDQHAFAHLFLCTYAWLFYHYHLIKSIFNKQKINTLSRFFRLKLYFCLVIVQLFVIQSILSSCHNLGKDQRCFGILPSFSLLFDQTFVDSGWSMIYQILRKNLVASLIVSFVLSCFTALLIPLILWISTLISNRLELYRQTIDAQTNNRSLHNLHGYFHVLSSSIVDFHQFRQDTNQFEFLHKFDLQHRISVSSLGEEIPQDSISNDISMNSNSNAMRFQSNRMSSPMIFKPYFSSTLSIPSTQRDENRLSDQTTTIDDLSTISNLSSTRSTFSSPTTTIKYKIDWPKLPRVPTKSMFFFLTMIHRGFILMLIVISIVGLFFIMKTCVKSENSSFTSETIFLHLLTIVLTPICEFIFISIICLINAVFFHFTDKNHFVSPIVEIPVRSETEFDRPPLDHSFVLHRDLTLTEEQLCQRIRHRFLESSLIRSVRDVIGYVLFLLIVIFVVKQTAKNVETRLSLRQSVVQILLRDNIFQQIDYLPDTMIWIRNVIEKRLFLRHEDYSCQKSTCPYVRIPDSPFYLSKSLRIRQIRLEQKNCSSCFTGGKNLLKSSSNVISDRRICVDVCNYTSIYSPLAYRQRSKLYVTYESPWFYQMFLSPEETIARCNRKRKYYDLTKYRWFDEKTFVVLIEGNLYSAEAAAMISFVFIGAKTSYGTIEKEIFIEVSDFALNVIENQTSKTFDWTNFLFALLLSVIFVTKMFDMVKFVRHFGFDGFVYLLRSLSNFIDGILFLFSSFYFLFIYFDRRVFQLESLRQLMDSSRLFVSFRVLIVNNAILNHFIGFICFVAILKFLNLLKFNPKTFLLAETISKSAEGFIVIFSLAFVNYFLFTLIARLFFSNEKHFESLANGFRLVLTSSIKEVSLNDEFVPLTSTRAIWQIFLWIFSAKFIEYFLISFVIEKFSKIRKTHQLTDEERLVGKIFVTFANYFAFHRDN